MGQITLSEILDDLRVANEALRRFEGRYWLSSVHFFELYSQGLLDNGEHLEDFSEWAAYYKLKLKREAALERISQQRLDQLQHLAGDASIDLRPQEPVLEIA